jgi:hypothetical protein
VVLRFARKYIKNVEGAAATDLQVSLTGGSLIFRNFELNLEGAAIQAYKLGSPFETFPIRDALIISTGW